MRISDILQQKGGTVVTIEGHTTVHEAIRTLNEHRIGALIVTGENGKLSGIITERDVLRICAEGCAHLLEASQPEERSCPATVRDVMTKDLIVGVLEDDLPYVMGIMTKNRIRHLPVLDEGKLVGIISIGDVVNALVDEREFENRLLTDYIHGLR